MADDYYAHNEPGLVKKVFFSNFGELQKFLDSHGIYLQLCVQVTFLQPVSLEILKNINLFL